MNPNADRQTDTDPAAKAAEVSASLEAEKLSFERERLEFERLKFAAEQAKRGKEIEKLDEEILEFRRPLWKKSSSIGALATIGVAVIAGFLAFGTDIFKSNIGSLVTDRSRLQKAVAQLTVEENALKSNTVQLQQQKDSLVKDKQALAASQAKLEVQRDALVARTDSLRLQKKGLEHDVLLAPIQTRISLLQPDTSFTMFLSNPSEESIRVLADFATAHRNDPSIIDFFQKSFNQAQQNSTRAALAFVLYRSTGGSQWKDAIRKAAVDDLGPWKGLIRTGFDALPYYLQLLDSPDLFSDDEKTDILRALYLKITEKQPIETDESIPAADRAEFKRLKVEIANNEKALVMDKTCTIAKWNKHATVAFREPWFACQDGLLEKLLEDLKVDADLRASSGEFYGFSHQIYGIAILQETQSLGVSAFQDGEIITPESATQEGKCTAFDASFPLCVDWTSRQPANPDESDPFVHVWYKSFPEYGQWLKQNSEVVSALLDPNHKVLSKASDDVMGKLFDGVWITRTDIEVK
jgi:hypothetical protein